MKASLQSKKHNIALLFFIVAMLFAAQTSSLMHGADHFHHDENELCESFLVFDGSSPIVGSAEEFSIDQLATHTESQHIKSCSQCSESFYSIRAPPYFYS